MTTLRDLINDDIVSFLEQYDASEPGYKPLEDIIKDKDVLLDEIMETISEKIGTIIGN